MPQTLLRLAASLASGLLLVFISAPVNLDWAHWFSFIPMLLAMRPGDTRKNVLIAYAGGWLAIFILYWWLIETIGRFSNIPWGIGLLLHMFFSAVFSVAYAWVFPLAPWLRRKFGLGWLLLWPALEVASEQIPALFPYYHGISQYQNPYTFQFASLGGVSSLTFFIFMTNALGAELIWRRQERAPLPWKSIGAIATSIALIFAFGAWRLDHVRQKMRTAPILRVGILQQSVTMEERLQDNPFEAFASWVALTIKLDGQDPDLVVWPEGATVLNPDDTRNYRQMGGTSPMAVFTSLATRLDADLLIGGGTVERVERSPAAPRGYLSYNSAYGFTRDGALNGRYDKLIPLPFGEYIPFAETFPFLSELIAGPGDFRAGEVATTFDGTTSDGSPYTYSSPICYEAILNLAMTWLYEGSREKPVDLFVVITNDAWFGDTAAPHQHAMLTTAQTMHYGRPMVRMAHSGVSWVVTLDGSIRGQTMPFTEFAGVIELPLATIDTPYSKGGWTFPWICLGVSVASLAWGRRRP